MILITGFKPFLNQKINPTELIINNLIEEKWIDANNKLIVGSVLPVEFDGAFQKLQDLINQYNPECIIMLGQAFGRSLISLEKIALNWNETNHPDESNFNLKWEKLIPL